MNKIIIGYDGTEPSKDALSLGRILAESLDAQPIVIVAIPWPNYLMGREDLARALEAEAGPMLDAASEALGGLSPITQAVATRSTAEELSEIARREGVTAIVVGSCHRGALGRVALGSVSTSLLHGAPCAVAVAPVGFAEGDHGLEQVAVAFDESPEAWSALEAGIGMVQQSHGQLTVLTIADLPTHGYGTASTVVSAAEMQAAEHGAKQQILDRALERVPGGVRVEGRLLTGPAAALLAQSSEEFDLMLIGSRGYGPLGRTLLGSVATPLVHSSDCAVIVVPRGAGANPLRVGETSTLAKAPA